MSSSGNNPSLNPANQGTLAGTLQFVFNKFMQDVNGMLPAQIIAFDRTANRAQVQPLISMLTTSGAAVPRSQIASVPVLLLGGGGFMLNFNLKPGDLGWIAANDRDISLFLQSYGQTAPNTTRVFDFSDGLFIPDVMRGYTIASDDNASAVLQSIDGTVKISLGTNTINIVANSATLPNTINVTANGAAGVITATATTVIIDGSLEATAGITVTGSAPVTITGDVNMTGTLAVNGGVNVTGNTLMTGNLHVTGTITNP
jgi:hypothetical protein